MDSAQLQASGSDASESPTQKQARLRRERREAKIKAGGSSRLDKITQLSGRPAEPRTAFLNALKSSTHEKLINEALSTQASLPIQDIASTLDPEEIDITHHPYTSRSLANNTANHSSSGPPDTDIRALLRSESSPRGVGTAPGQSQEQDDDPMMRLLHQMMGGIAGEPGVELDGRLKKKKNDMLSSTGGGGSASMPGIGSPGQQQGASVVANKSAYVWRILHALSALMLGIYLVSHASFTSSSRLTPGRSIGQPPTSPVSGTVETDQPVTNMFWIFATAELVLQGSRFVLEQGKDCSQGGWLHLIGGVLPEPWRGWARLTEQYSGIWKTLAEDAMVVVFVLGIVGWWRGMEGLN